MARLASRAEPTRIEPLTAELTRLHVTVSRRLLAKLAAARDALSHSHPGAADDAIIEIGLDLVIKRHRKRRGIGAKPRSGARATDPAAALSQGPGAGATAAAAAEQAAAPRPAPAPAAAPTAPPPPKRSRHVPAHVWRAVWERDGGRCVWPVDGGGVCGSTRRLELDHVDGFALGAESTVDGCRLLCACHNDLHARTLYGDALMDRYTRGPRGGRCSEPVADYATERRSRRARRARSCFGHSGARTRSPGGAGARGP